MRVLGNRILVHSITLLPGSDRKHTLATEDDIGVATVEIIIVVSHESNHVQQIWIRNIKRIVFASILAYRHTVLHRNLIALVILFAHDAIIGLAIAGIDGIVHHLHIGK